MSGGSKSHTQTQEIKPWKDQIPFIKKALDESHKLFEEGPLEVYGGSIIPQLSTQTEDALNMMQQGIQLDPNVTNNTSNMISKTLGGDFLGSNPYLDQTVQRAQDITKQNFLDVIRPGIDSRFIQAGRTGSPAHMNTDMRAAELVGRQMGDIATDIYGNAYNAERRNQISTLGLVPGFLGQQANIGRTNIGLATQAGSVVDAFNRAKAIEEEQKFQAQQIAPYENLERFWSMAASPLGKNITSTQPVYSNDAAKWIGLASLVAAPFTGGASLALGGLGNAVAGSRGGYNF